MSDWFGFYGLIKSMYGVFKKINDKTKAELFNPESLAHLDKSDEYIRKIND